MAFEISEYVYFTAIVLLAALLSTTAGALLISLGVFVFVISVYALLLRTHADYERARLTRILGSLVIILMSALSGTSYIALFVLLWTMGVLIITVSEHISHRSYIPIDRA